MGSLFQDDLPVVLQAVFRSSPQVVLEEGKAAVKLFLTAQVGAVSPAFQSFLSINVVSVSCERARRARLSVPGVPCEHRERTLQACPSCRRAMPFAPRSSSRGKGPDFAFTSPTAPSDLCLCAQPGTGGSTGMGSSRPTVKS